jgi:hypothetical protein
VSKPLLAEIVRHSRFPQPGQALFQRIPVRAQIPNADFESIAAKRTAT